MNTYSSQTIQKTEEKGRLPNSFYETRITMIKGGKNELMKGKKKRSSYFIITSSRRAREAWALDQICYDDHRRGITYKDRTKFLYLCVRGFNSNAFHLLLRNNPK